jgi:hypothetical protein
MKKLLAVFLISLIGLMAKSQVIYPGGGVYAISDVPGLRTELDTTLTNAVKGADTGGSTGNVTKVGRQAVVQFPTIPSMLYITTNSIHGTAYIDSSGTTTVSYVHTFSNIPFITLTPFGTNIAQLLTPVLLDVTHSDVTFVVVSSGSIITNAYRVDWQANDGAGLSWAGTSLAAVGGATNLYLNDGSQAMGIFYFPVGSGAGKWLVSDASGYGSWESKTIANLTDGAEVFKRDGSVLPTTNLNMNGKQIVNATKVQITDGAGAGRVLLSDASGYGSWYVFPSWSPAVSALNMAGYGISAVGTLGVNGAATFAGSETHAGTVAFNGIVNANSTLNVAGTFSGAGRVNANKTGGSYGSPDFYSAGYSRFNGTADFRGQIYGYEHLTIVKQITTLGSLWTGDQTWITANWTAASSGNVYAEHDIYAYHDLVAAHDVVSYGTKTFRIPHPRDANKWLFHASMESPNVELIYRGKVTLVNGIASVNLNTYYGLIPQTLDAMLTNLTVHVYDNAGWTQVRCKSISGVSFEIEAKDTTCMDEVEWIAIGTRCDAGVADYKIEANK